MEANQFNKPKDKRFIPVTNWPQYHSWPPIGGLRHLIFHEKTNGFDKCVIRAGRRVLIDESAFLQWLESQREDSCKK